MKKRNQSQQEESLLKEDSEQDIYELYSSLQQLEQGLAEESPDLHWFEARVVEGKQQVKKTRKRSLVLFCSIATILLFSFGLMLVSNPLYYLIIQIGGLLILPLVLLDGHKRRGDY